MFERAFTRLAKQTDDAKIDLDEGMWLIAMLVDPAADREKIDKQLDRLAARVQARLGKDVDAKTADPQKVVAALRQVIFSEEKFNGNTANYDHPDIIINAFEGGGRKGTQLFSIKELRPLFPPSGNLGSS